jgi:hypothetical protein
MEAITLVSVMMSRVMTGGYSMGCTHPVYAMGCTHR